MSNVMKPYMAQTEDTIAVLWDKDENVSEYKIYVNGKFCGTTDKTDYTITGLKPDTEYEVCVKGGDITDEIRVKTEKRGNVLNVIDFGAVCDGKTISTKAIQRAIDECDNGDTVYVPNGKFKTGALYLKDNMTLCIDGTLLGSGDIRDYPIMQYRFEGLETACYASLINVADGNHSNIKIIGTGTIDANGEKLRKQEIAEKLGKIGRAVCIRNTKGLYMKDITVRQSPAWCVHFIYCDGVSVNNVKIHTKFDENGNRYKDIINGDGLDLDSSKNVFIFNSMIASQDDCIAIKSGRDDEGRAVGISSENIRVSNCVFKSGFGVAIGSEMSGGVRNVLVQDCTFENTYSIVSIKAPRGRGGVVENIHYENNTLVREKSELCDCEWFRGAVYVDNFYSHITFDSDKEEPITEGTPVIKDVIIENIKLDIKSGNAVYLVGLPEKPLENISLKNVHIVGDSAIEVKNVIKLDLKIR